MKLRFNVGAIVELSLLPNPSNQKITGKVINVTPDEIEVCPQLRVYRRNGNHDTLDSSVSADATYTLHIRRSLISYWRYVEVSALQRDGSIFESKSPLFLVDEKPFSMYQLNTYDSPEGFCKGTGEYCGECEESGSTMMIITSQKNDDVNNPELEVTPY